MRVLVANRGEIACRILRTLRAMNIESIAVCEAHETDAAHLFLADRVAALPSDAKPRGYLSVEAIVGAARAHQATHVHPGYGFLSQEPKLPEALSQANIAWMGPTANAMRQIGNKIHARALAEKLGIPVVPGATEVNTLEAAKQAANRLGYPVLIKAAAGGGGRGMRAVTDEASLPDAYRAAGREAKQAFGDTKLLLERLIFPARHIEVQVIADGDDAISLGTRECSLQRRYQKVVEEGPATAITTKAVKILEAYAVQLAQAVHYTGLGTVEFLVGPKEAIYFLEVNPRIQVEHPVTEMIGQTDLIERQIALARGQSDLALAPLSIFGHALEARLCAESPLPPFLPEVGEIARVVWPQGPGIRVDAGIEEGESVGFLFDPLLAKIIAWGPSREMARRRLVGALRELLIVGVTTNLPLLLAWLESDAFIAQEIFTHSFSEHAVTVAGTPEWAQELLVKTYPQGSTQARLGVQAQPEAASPWSSLPNFRMRLCGK